MPTQGGQTARPYQEVSPCNGGTFAGLGFRAGGALSKGGAENVNLLTVNSNCDIHAHNYARFYCGKLWEI